jgi:hypothetical protein
MKGDRWEQLLRTVSLPEKHKISPGRNHEMPSSALCSFKEGNDHRSLFLVSTGV